MNWFIKLANGVPIRDLAQFMELLNATMAYNLQSKVKRDTRIQPNLKLLLEQYESNPQSVTTKDFIRFLPEDIINQIISKN